MKAAAARGGARFEFPIGNLVPYAIPFAIAGAALLVTAPSVWLILLTDGVWPVAVIASAAGWGAWPARSLRGARWTATQELSLSVAVGLGILGAATLGLGVAGWLNFPTSLALLAAGALAGLVRLGGLARRGVPCRHGRPTGEPRLPDSASPPSGSACPDSAPHHARRQVLLATLALLPLCVPLYVMAFGACLPPGVLWPEEANGYDVLEYHLQGPREWFERGRIEFLPHNVYTSFPQQTEILYLLLMHLHRDAHAAAIPSQLLHAALGVLAVFAIGAWLPAGWPRILGVALAGTTPWIAYLGCLAYVENAMLFFAAVAAGIVLTWYRDAASATRGSALAAGLCAGLAGACKYTALVFVAAALLATIALTLRPAMRSMSIRRFLAPIAACYLLGVTLGIGPWLARNTAFTGNPVYPFAYDWFGGRGWSDEQNAQWRQAHNLRGTENGFIGRFGRAAGELFRGSAGSAGQAAIGSSYFGLLPVATILGLAGLLWLPWVNPIRRDALLLGLWAVLIFLSWAMLTHVPGRFAVVLIVPLASALALTISRFGQSEFESPIKRLVAETPQRFAYFALAALTLAAGIAVLISTFRAAQAGWQQRVGMSMTDVLGRSDALLENHPLNVILPKDAFAWLVGDAAVFYVNRRAQYHTVFNRDPWIEFSREHDAAASVTWLRERGVTHVVFNWPEIERLRKTYGFSERVTREWAADLRGAGLEAAVVPGEMENGLRGTEVLTVGR